MTHSFQPRNPSAILALGTALPPYSASQEDIATWMASSYVDQPAVGRLIRTLYAYSGIERRYGLSLIHI